MDIMLLQCGNPELRLPEPLTVHTLTVHYFPPWLSFKMSRVWGQIRHGVPCRCAFILKTYEISALNRLLGTLCYEKIHRWL